MSQNYKSKYVVGKVTSSFIKYNVLPNIAYKKIENINEFGYFAKYQMNKK